MMLKVMALRLSLNIASPNQSECVSSYLLAKTILKSSMEIQLQLTHISQSSLTSEATSKLARITSNAYRQTNSTKS